MDLTISSRHVTVPESLRNQAEQRFARLEKLDRRVTGGTLVLAGEGNLRRAEARVSLAGSPPLLGTGEGPTLRNAMDRAIGRLERQLKARHSRTIDRRSRRTKTAGDVQVP